MRSRHHLLYCSVTFAACMAFFLTAHGQPPVQSESANKPAPHAMKSKPQVIYHLPRSSSYAATLHSQAKTRDALPIDNSMPTSLQLSRAAANDAAVQAQQEPAATPNPENVREQHRKPAVKRTPSRGPQFRVYSPGRGKSHGNPHPGKGRKK
jgi:hypothetical protein